LAFLIQPEVAISRQSCDPGLDLLDDLLPRPTKKRGEPLIETKFASLIPDKVQDEAAFLPGIQPKASTKLLKEDCGALRRAEKEHTVGFWDVNAFIEQVDRKQDVHFSLSQPNRGSCSFLRRRLARDRSRRNACGLKRRRHELCMRDAHAETQAPRLVPLTVDFAELADDEICAARVSQILVF
jgi:hypothetical protein